MQKPEVYELGRTSTSELERVLNSSPEAVGIIKSWLEGKLGDEAMSTKVAQIVLNVQVAVQEVNQTEETPQTEAAIVK